MVILNEHYYKLQAGYLFPEIGRRVKAFADARPEAAGRILRCGIGDVTEPLPKAVIEALHVAVDEMGSRDTFRGYGPEQGYEWLRHAIAEHDYRAHGIDIADDEIFVSDGSKCDTGNILDVLGPGNRIAVSDPVYPVYVDTNVMAGNTGSATADGSFQGLVYLPCTAANGFVPEPPGDPVDVAYLCLPNNPTGAVATREHLGRWVTYAREQGVLLMFDAAYEAFISNPEIPHSIYEIPGADEVAVEFRSFSKNGGFTGLRCAFAVVPRKVMGRRADGTHAPLHALWLRRSTTKFNGVSYPVQRAAEALYSEAGRAQVRDLIAYYMGNAAILREALGGGGLAVYGGVNAPYIWVATPGGMRSWDAFDRILHDAHVVVTPGSGFGAMGEGYFRVSAFNSRENIEEVVRRFGALRWQDPE